MRATRAPGPISRASPSAGDRPVRLTPFRFTPLRAACGALVALTLGNFAAVPMSEPVGERRLTSAAHGHILTNVGAWSPDGRWVVYDVRSDPAGAAFDGTRIER